jgi:hypothetical protein
VLGLRFWFFEADIIAALSSKIKSRSPIQSHSWKESSLPNESAIINLAVRRIENQHWLRLALQIQFAFTPYTAKKRV